jgi:hypothetical protein
MFDIHGVYTDLHTDKSPTGIKLVVLIQLTGGHGRTPLQPDWIGPDGNALASDDGFKNRRWVQKPR